MTDTSYEVPSVSCDPTEWLDVLEQQRDEGFTFFDFLTAVDETDAEADPGFDVVVHLYDVTAGALREVLVHTRIDDGATLPSCTGLWSGAAWHERETFEMFGIGFDGFTDPIGGKLRKLLLPDAFDGNPLRKSFVLTARASKPWPGAKEPGGGGTDGKPARAPRRRLQPPGVPDESWGPR
ncbi:NADH-quinone oxidoreductase subunit C [Flexivirga oryzae]|uniref:NADH-quinone oxidoreductase subunit C n=1 Tax=Flexivirga oryzae TaxID=1794944 RepID=A0A839NAE2_9MICO|nr:NADH-quinone oxidoreductase subunit C [Flexivirga oryzae]